MNILSQAGEVRQKFRELYGSEPAVYRAPGRVNLIGEHTDYNDGYVMPAAIEFYVWIAIGPRADKGMSIYSLNFSEQAEIGGSFATLQPRNHWSDYVVGVAAMLVRTGHSIRGANLAILGNVPIGSGLSSSAAIEVVTGFALLANSGLSLEMADLATICRRAENEFVGARVGIMDPFVSCSGQVGCALMLDCRSLDYRLLPFPPQTELVMCNTMVKHALASGEYNTRRSECEEAVQLLSRALPGVRSLRDVTLPQLESHAPLLPRTIYRRCRHVITENERVRQAADALEAKDLEKFGRLMFDSHRSLRDDFQVSSAELDLMVELAREQSGVIGARMTGGGFGGCTVNLVETDGAAEFQRNVAMEYAQATGISPQVFVSFPAGGVTEVKD